MADVENGNGAGSLHQHSKETDNNSTAAYQNGGNAYPSSSELKENLLFSTIADTYTCPSLSNFFSVNRAITPGGHPRELDPPSHFLFPCPAMTFACEKAVFFSFSV